MEMSGFLDILEMILKIAYLTVIALWAGYVLRALTCHLCFERD